ncbi:Protein Y64G10A.6 [Aphelenchoides avenae]|nr:Protein Y64G10A.6 [Aphelenchus avenae]
MRIAIQCHVEQVDCDQDADFVPRVTDAKLIPGEAHDIRVEPFAKAVPRRQGESYQLSVDISWQTPPNNSTKLLEAFLLEIDGSQSQTHVCFLFNISDANWTSHAISSSPRLHFSTDSVFRFGQAYDVTVYSLPETWNVTRSVQKSVVMPHNPALSSPNSHLSPNCSYHSHPYASKWTAGFRRIMLHSLAKTIQIEFVGAPPQYCFEQYEVRLLDETGLELLHSDTISVDQMRSEVIGNTTVVFGEYNFTQLDLDKSYIPSVIAVERASDGRCLCPVYGVNKDLYDNKVVCSCVAADWKPVKLQRLNLTQPECPGCGNATVPHVNGPATDDDSGS